jgi:hypothetical protein
MRRDIESGGDPMPTKEDQLVEEFAVQVYTSGRIDWDRLDVFLSKNEAARRRLAVMLEGVNPRGGTLIF